MTFRERILRTFERKRIDRVAWQPRIYYWYNGRYDEGTMPEKYMGMSMLDIYDDLHASPRYPKEVVGISIFKMELCSIKIPRSGSQPFVKKTDI